MSLISSTSIKPVKLICFAASAAAGFAAITKLINNLAPTFQYKTECSTLLACTISIPLSQSKVLAASFTALCLAYVQLYNPPPATQQPSSTAPKPTTATAPKPQTTPVSEPKTILAPEGINQYRRGGVSACTLLACRFIAQKDAASPEMIKQIIDSNTYTDEHHLDTEKCIDKNGLSRAENPWFWMAQEEMHETAKSSPMDVSFKDNDVNNLTAAIKILLETNEITGAIITANGLTIGMRKIDGSVEFFDSHGDAERNGNNAAYIVSFSKDSTLQIISFLKHRFPELPVESLIQIWPITKSKSHSMVRDIDPRLDVESIRSYDFEYRTFQINFEYEEWPFNTGIGCFCAPYLSSYVAGAFNPHPTLLRLQLTPAMARLLPNLPPDIGDISQAFYTISGIVKANDPPGVMIPPLLFSGDSEEVVSMGFYTDSDSEIQTPEAEDPEVVQQLLVNGPINKMEKRRYEIHDGGRISMQGRFYPTQPDAISCFTAVFKRNNGETIVSYHLVLNIDSEWKDSVQKITDTSETLPEVIERINALNCPTLLKNMQILTTCLEAQPQTAPSGKVNTVNSKLQLTSTPLPVTVRSPKIPCSFIIENDHSNLINFLNFYFDVPTLIDYVYPISRPTTHLLQLKVKDMKELIPFLPNTLTSIIPNGRELSASILVVKVDQKQKWYELCFHGLLAREKVDGKFQNYPRSNRKDVTRKYSWKANVGMFGRFGHADENQPAVIAARQNLHISRSVSRDNLTTDPIFLPFEKLDLAEQQIDDKWPTVRSQGTSIYISGEQPIEGGFFLCHNEDLAHISLVMVCDDATGKSIEKQFGGSSKIDALLTKLKTIQGSESAIAVLENIKL